MKNAGVWIGLCSAPATGNAGCIERCGQDLFQHENHRGTAKLYCCSLCRHRAVREKARRPKEAA